MNIIKRVILTLFCTSLLASQTMAAKIILTLEKELQYQQMVLQAVNQYRSSKGLSPLILKTVISEEAKQHSVDMANKKMPFGHKDFDKRIMHIKNHIPSFKGGAENIACFKLPPKEVVKKWLTSRGHRRNIEGKYNLTGIGIVQDKKGWLYYTQIFVKNDQVKKTNLHRPVSKFLKFLS
ncbi:CAP domain-containing protein [Legionella israelensis]|uniref:CAP domain-containing protein n=1 Tax=Legionella israelensis TaxID=454 RepID=UPI001FD57339|nr:CAP domain-containing protein [Legionella israelensis]